MQRRNRRLNLVGAAAAMAHGFVDQSDSLRDHRLIPQRAILIVEQHQHPIGVEASGGAGVLQQQ